ncbi:Protein of unknown function [Bacillus cereus]|nr:Protein of unknown function [Bacillus cereus]
MVNVISL